VLLRRVLHMSDLQFQQYWRRRRVAHQASHEPIAVVSNGMQMQTVAFGEWRHRTGRHLRPQQQREGPEGRRTSPWFRWIPAQEFLISTSSQPESNPELDFQPGRGERNIQMNISWSRQLCPAEFTKRSVTWFLPHCLFRLEAKPGKEDEVASFLKSGLSLVQEEPATIAWFGIRLGPTTFVSSMHSPTKQAARPI